MTPSLVILVLSGVAAQTTGTSTVGPDESLEQFRLPFEQVVDRTVGSAARPVRFDWRKTDLHLAIFAAQPVEFNNFNSFRLGLLARFPSDVLIFELGLSYVWVFNTSASKQLELTPYRQAGRPSRFEIDLTLGIPLAEGVVTVLPKWFPVLEMVFSVLVNFRYLFYPTGYEDVSTGSAFASLLSPQISSSERRSLDDNRKDGMEVDNQRYYLLAGFGLDIYMRSGIFVSPRLALAIPIFAAIVGSEMSYALDVSLAIGVAF